MVWKNETGSKMPFGKYKGTYIEDLPYSYLTWLLEQSWFEKQYKFLMIECNEEWLERRENQERMDE